ncbi:superoxide dismutase [Candidatus Uhrbacteria bacterium]|nr:superoxide dismutase [Candidatus Uhrbacteria bacterium]
MEHTASSTSYEPKPLPFQQSLIGISEKAMQIHHDKLYAGYVQKMQEIGEKLKVMCANGVGLDSANATYSELRALRDGETFAVNGVYLHEYYFNVLGGNGKPEGSLVDAIVAKYGTLEQFVAFFSATGMAVRGWVVLAWDTHAGRLKIYGADSHNQGGVWGAMPIIVLDVYEHAYFMDYGSDRKKYIEDFWTNMNWAAATAVYERARGTVR